MPARERRDPPTKRGVRATPSFRLFNQPPSSAWISASTSSIVAGDEMATTKDPLISAVEAVHAALKDLDPTDVRRVLASVGALLQVPLATQTDRPAVMKERGSESGDALARPSARPLSIVELLQEKEPSTSAERITLFAYYREKYEGLGRFSRGDLQPYFAKAHLKPPTNYDRDFVAAVKKGWLHEDQDQSYITSKGIEAVEAGFPADRALSRTAKGTSLAKKSGSKSARPKKRVAAAKSHGKKSTSPVKRR